MDRYIYVRSDESDIFFGDNENHRYRVQLQYPLNLPGTWKVALVEFHATETIPRMSMYRKMTENSLTQRKSLKLAKLANQHRLIHSLHYPVIYLSET